MGRLFMDFTGGALTLPLLVVKSAAVLLDVLVNIFVLGLQNMLDDDGRGGRCRTILEVPVFELDPTASTLVGKLFFNRFYFISFSNLAVTRANLFLSQLEKSDLHNPSRIIKETSCRN